jgi:hypothetical protein
MFSCKEAKNYDYIPELMKTNVRYRIGMNRKVVLGQYDPRRVSSVLVPIQPPPSVFLYYLFSQNNDIPLPNNYYVSELNKSQENNHLCIMHFYYILCINPKL